VGFLGLVAVLILGLYLIHPIVGGHRFPIGPDGPVYVWWSRYANAEGVGVLPGRFGVPAIALLLGTAFGTQPLQTVAILGPVFAAASGLAATALTESLLGHNLLRSLTAAVLTAAWAGHLAAGYLGNLAVAAMFLGAIAAFGLGERSWRAVILGGGLVATAALTHRPLLLLCLAILGGAAAILVPDVVRRRRRGTAVFDTVAGRLTAGAAAGAALGTGLGFVAGPAPDRSLVETSQDAFLRNHGLEGLLERQFRLRLAADGRRAAVPMAAAAALGVMGGLRRLWGRSSETRFLLAACASWAALSLAGVSLLLVTGGPANRLVTFALFFPVIAAVGVETLSRRRTLGVTIAFLGVLTIAAMSVYGWYRQEPFIDRTEVEAVQATRGAIDALPPTAPVVFLVDTDQKAAAFHVTRFANVIRTSVPQDRIADVRVAVGRPDDYLAGRPTLTGNPEHDSLSRAYLEESREEARIVFVLEAFNRSGYPAATRMGGVLAPGVVALRTGFSADPLGAHAPTRSGSPPGLGPTALVFESLVALALLTVLGAGWARWGLPGAPLEGFLAAAASVGLASLVLGAVAADTFGVAPGGPGGVAAALLIAAAGHAAAARAGLRAN
jgi:hypothetical protein